MYCNYKLIVNCDEHLYLNSIDVTPETLQYTRFTIIRLLYSAHLQSHLYAATSPIHSYQPPIIRTSLGPLFQTDPYDFVTQIQY